MRGRQRGERVLEHHLHAPAHAAQVPRGRRCRCARRPIATSPPAIGCSASSAMPSVVLPEPDSPTMPSVSPRRSCSVASLHRLELALAEPALRDTGKRHAARSLRLHQHRRIVGHRLHHALRPAGQQLAACRRAAGRRTPAPSAPLSTSSPRSITPTRWVKRRTRFRSWVMNSSAMPISRCSSSSRARIWAWIVTSSAVVGSSADQQLGPAGQRHGDHRALALAAGQLVRVGVDAPLGLGDAGARQQLDGARARRVRAQRLRAAPAPRRSGCPPCTAGSAPSSAPGRSCDAALPRMPRISRSLLRSRSAPSKRIAPVVTARIDQPQHRQRGDRSCPSPIRRPARTSRRRRS